MELLLEELSKIGNPSLYKYLGGWSAQLNLFNCVRPTISQIRCKKLYATPMEALLNIGDKIDKQQSKCNGKSKLKEPAILKEKNSTKKEYDRESNWDYHFQENSKQYNR